MNELQKLLLHGLDSLEQQCTQGLITSSEFIREQRKLYKAYALFKGIQKEYSVEVIKADAGNYVTCDL
jgi:hypothetical protein